MDSNHWHILYKVQTAPQIFGWVNITQLLKSNIELIKAKALAKNGYLMLITENERAEFKSFSKKGLFAQLTQKGIDKLNESNVHFKAINFSFAQLLVLVSIGFVFFIICYLVLPINNKQPSLSPNFNQTTINKIDSIIKSNYNKSKAE
ncbi:MAG: hypothetical protein ACPGLV_04950 [Bacteroidia bacterium]